MPGGLPVGAMLRVASHMTGILFFGGRGDAVVDRVANNLTEDANDNMTWAAM